MSLFMDNMPSCRLAIGSKVIDLLHPLPEQLDLEAIDRRLSVTYRFTNNPEALTVKQHVRLACLLAEHENEGPDVIEAIRHHDDHEGIIGDIPGPIKTYLSFHTGALDDIEAGLDAVIYAAHGLPLPDKEMRRIVHHYDKLAETVEWLFVLGQPAEPWNRTVPDDMSDALLLSMLADCCRAA